MPEFRIPYGRTELIARLDGQFQIELLAPATVSQNVSRLHDIAAADLQWSSVHQSVGNGPMCTLQDAAECGP